MFSTALARLYEADFGSPLQAPPASFPVDRTRSIFSGASYASSKFAYRNSHKHRAIITISGDCDFEAEIYHAS